jgi:prevent-host-death family protein
MQTVNVHQAKTHVSRLLADVAKGEEVIIAKAGRPIARLVLFEESVRQRVFGKDAGLFEVPDDFDAPLPADVIAEFER